MKTLPYLTRLRHTTLLPLVGAAFFALYPLTASAAPQSNCDFRILNLSEEQQQEWKTIRRELKETYAQKESAPQDRKSKLNKLGRLLNSTSFDSAAAQRLLQDDYNPQIDSAVDDLAIQHRLFHVLTPQQREIWLKNCAY